MSSSETTERINIVILYDRITSAGRAMAAYSHLKRELESEYTPELRIWRIDIAMLPEFSAQATDEIQSAEMIILAVRGSQPCPAAFLRWTDGAGENRSLPWRALIGLIEEADEPANSAGTWNTILRGTARQIQPYVFLWVCPAVTGSSPRSTQFSEVNTKQCEETLESARTGAVPGI
jgi:hypothetical protein